MLQIDTCVMYQINTYVGVLDEIPFLETLSLYYRSNLLDWKCTCKSLKDFVQFVLFEMPERRRSSDGAFGK